MGLCMLRVPSFRQNDCLMTQITFDLVNSIVWIYSGHEVDAIFHTYDNGVGD
jgi:hypothetical protein